MACKRSTVRSRLAPPILPPRVHTFACSESNAVNAESDALEVDFRGHWINQNGSTLSIVDQSGGSICGRFVSKKGRAAQGVEYPVIGCVNGELATFLVNFVSSAANLHSITSFSGRHTRGADGRERLHTVWILARQFEDDACTKPTQVWNSFVTNSDVFEKSAEVD